MCLKSSVQRQLQYILKLDPANYYTYNTRIQLDALLKSMKINLELIIDIGMYLFY